MPLVGPQKDKKTKHQAIKQKGDSQALILNKDNNVAKVINMAIKFR